MWVSTDSVRAVETRAGTAIRIPAVARATSFGPQSRRHHEAAPAPRLQHGLLRVHLGLEQAEAEVARPGASPAEQAGWLEEDDQRRDDKPEGGCPLDREVGGPDRLGEGEHQRRDHRAGHASEAADDGNRESLQHEVEAGEGVERVGGGKQSAGQRGDGAAEDERQRDERRHRDADQPGGGRVLGQGPDAAAGLGALEEDEQQDHDDGDRAEQQESRLVDDQSADLEDAAERRVDALAARCPK